MNMSEQYLIVVLGDVQTHAILSLDELSISIEFHPILRIKLPSCALNALLRHVYMPYVCKLTSCLQVGQDATCFNHLSIHSL